MSQRQDGLTAGDVGFLRHRAKPLVENVVRNLGRAISTGRPLLLRPHRSHVDRIVIVGAGPSLEKNRHLLRAAQAAGITVACVNASASAIAEHVDEGATCVTRELLAVGHTMALPDGCTLIADLGAHEQVFARADAFFVPSYSCFYELATTLGVPMLPAGSAALTSVVAMAIEAGAQDVALVGVDLAFARDGNGYAAQSSWEGFRHTGGQIEGAGLSAMRGVAAAVGLPPSVNEDSRTREVPAWDGGEPLRALESWCDQAAWLEMTAKRQEQVSPRVRFVNATEGGRSLAGWCEEPLGEWIARAKAIGSRPRVWDAHAVDPQRGRECLLGLLEACSRVERIAAEILEPTPGGLLRVADLHKGGSLLDTWASREFIDADDLPVARKLEAYETARIAAAARIRAIIQGGGWL